MIDFRISKINIINSYIRKGDFKTNRYMVLQKVLDTGSFTKAAEVLGYTQSSVSQMIASLEEELSIKLLKRSRAGVKLTLEGEAIYPFIQRTISQYQSIKEKVNEIKGLDVGTIRIAVYASISCHWMPKLLKGFQQSYPNIQFVLYQGDYGSTQERIKDGTVDFAFVSPNATSDLETILLKEGNLLAILPRNHRLASQNTVDLEDLLREPFILLDDGLYNEQVEVFDSLKLSPNIKYRIQDDYTIMSMVESGLGVSILAELMLYRTNYNIVLKPTNPPISRTIAIGYKDKESLPIASKKFIEYIIENIDKLP